MGRNLHDKLSAALQEDLITEWINLHHGILNPLESRKLVSLRRLVLDSDKHILRKPSPIDNLFNLLANSTHIFPKLVFITVARFPLSWLNFLCKLCRLNSEAMLSGTKCIERLSFHQSLHATIIRWLTYATKAKVLKVVEHPAVREG